MEFEAEKIPLEKLPKPAGWKLLVAPVKINEKSSGGIVIVEDSIKAMEYFRDVAKVVAVGDSCYRGASFRDGNPLNTADPAPWCKVGDIIQHRPYTGVEITLKHEGEISKLRIINDDEVMTVVDDLSVLNFL